MMPNHQEPIGQEVSTYPEPAQLFTTVQPTTVPGKIIQFPLCRFVLVLAFLSPVNLAGMALDQSLTDSSGWAKLLLALAASILMYAVYCLYTRLIERRKASELALRGSVAEFGRGFGIGTALMVTVVAVLAVGGYYRIESFDPNPAIAVQGFLRMFSAAFLEEMVFRLIVFKITEEALGSWLALVVQAALFGLVHAGNPNATWFSSVAIMVEAGVLLAAAFMYTRRIWMIFGLHLAWNFIQSTVFGLTVSGHTVEGLVRPSVTGPEWLTGGAFGVEASWLAVGLCLMVGLVMLKRVVGVGRTVQPVWRRSKKPSLFPADVP
ncbi:MAG: CPBP family intramembrane metalloprotease [candidate division Zixibacteria bacterium]|nr:CPBP family intramembrane metalloprotease [candidate division Zixibacteria bacterium]MDH3937281.1 CPBP family intramembrane metalloprotease [candidate division Zixibacteria bacterium]MDH4033339.1 CPBP family intramembrane metalloprotease [candidate division Zixibacteria bacterium]